ncbi:MAG: NAD+ synthase [Thiotrichaceae bacterium]|nr:NAD+ synthase [Thiotrichaceae bacterium]
MSDSISLAIAQLNPCVGDFDQNQAKILDSIAQAKKAQQDCIVFPEMMVTGYPAEDLLFRPAFLQKVEQVLVVVAEASVGITVIIGAPMLRDGKLYNIAAVFQEGKRVADYAKQHLPNYRVFDEERYFTAGNESLLIPIGGVSTAILICEDIWQEAPLLEAKKQGAEAVIVLNASPFREDKAFERYELLQRKALQVVLPIAYINLVGGQDELVFDGHSLVVDKEGALTFQAQAFTEQTYFTELLMNRTVNKGENYPLLVADSDSQIYQALVCGVHDYVAKNGFKGILLGLSGGIDSALTLAIAVDALGADQVEAVMMPFVYTADISITDARQQAETLGVTYHEIPIEPIFNCFMETLSTQFGDSPRDVTEENIQARSRGVILMAMSNKQGKMLLATGNKSEMSMGYATLYGDMAGGFAPLKDVYKTRVFALSRYRNQCGDGEIIPDRVITRPPSAELAPDQKDEDSLPPYPVLDEILRLFIEEFQSVDDISAQGFDKETVHFVAERVLLNEHKRRQGALGIRISQRAFGKDRRYPITSAYRRYL